MNQSTPSNPSQSSQLSRRDFIRMTALSAGAASLSFPSILQAANAGSKLHVAVIGLGKGKGLARLSEAIDTKLVQIVALCDVDSDAVNAGKFIISKSNAKADLPSVRVYSDYRKLLASEKNLDAVIIATPDHWHAPIAKASMQAGKHVFCEKPLTHTVSEARELITLASQSKIVTQMGNQGSASDNMRRAIEVIQAGALGSVKEVHCWAHGVGSKPGLAMPKTGDPVPANLNWDEWVGPAPFRPYKKGYYHPWEWRGWLDFGSGAMGDFGCHNLNLPTRALKLDYPKKIEIDAQLMGLPTYPKQARIRYDFAARGDLSPATVWWYDGGRQPDPSVFPTELSTRFGGRIPDGVLIIGENGFTYGGPWNGCDYICLKGDRKPIGIANHPALKNIPQTIPRIRGQHVLEWVQACMGGNPTFSPFQVGGHLTEIALSGVVALRTMKALEWDGAAMKATNAPEADQFIHAKYRSGWI